MHILILLIVVPVVVVGLFPEHHPVQNKFYPIGLERRSSSIIETDVLIIGAGIAGLEAARLLNQYGINAIVLEARNRTGGRIWSVQLKNNHIFDVGAAWIHGIGGSIPSGLMTNPLWDLAQEAQVETHATDADDLQIFYRNPKGNFDAQDWYDEFISYVRDKVKEQDETPTVQEFADIFMEENNFTEGEKEIFRSFLHMSIENQEATELETISAKDWAEITSNHYGEEHVFHHTGFMAITQYLADNAKDIRLEQIVTKISYNETGVEVQTKNNQIYQAKYVLNTVPLGVLKAKTIEFNPPLPRWKQNAIDRIGFGLMNKVILLWDKAWWNSTNYFFLRVSSNPRQYPFWVNSNKWNDRPALICYFIGEEARRLESEKNNTHIIVGMIDALREMFPGRNISWPIDGFITRWEEDQFAYGSYAHISIKQKRDDPAYLAEPIGDRLLFAGEATNVDTYGFAHGALMSARREVTRLLHVYGVEPNRTIIKNSTTSSSSFGLLTILCLVCVQLLPWTGH